MRFATLFVSAAITVGALAAPVQEKKRSDKLQYFGINESGAEFGTALPGTYGVDYTWYDLSTYDVCTLCSSAHHVRVLIAEFVGIHRQGSQHLPIESCDGTPCTEQTHWPY